MSVPGKGYSINLLCAQNFYFFICLIKYYNLFIHEMLNKLLYCLFKLNGKVTTHGNTLDLFFKTWLKPHTLEK